MRGSAVRGVVGMAVLGGLLACASRSAWPDTGSAGPVTWEIREMTQTARADGLASRWDYVIVLRSTRGVGIRFEKVRHVLFGQNLSSVPHDAPYGGRLEPWDELRLTVFDWVRVDSMVAAGLGVRPGGDQFTAVRRLIGTDDSGQAVTVEVRASLGPETGRLLPPPRTAPGPHALPPVPVTDLKAIIAEWQGHYRDPEGFDLPLRLVIGENGSFEASEGDPVRLRYQGRLSLDNGQLAWSTRTGAGTLALHDDRRTRVLAGRVVVAPADGAQPFHYDVRVEALPAAVPPGMPPVVAARPAPPPAAGGLPAATGPAIAVRFPLDQARLDYAFTVVVADVTSSEVLTSAAVSVNGARVHGQSDPGTRALALNVPIALRGGSNVIVVSATDALGGVREEIRTVVHEPPAGVPVSYRVRGSALWVNLLYRASDGRTEQKQVMVPPDAAWELLFIARQGDSLEVTAQSLEEPGSVTCEIIVDGRPIVERSGSQSAPVTCRGVVAP